MSNKDDIRAIDDYVRNRSRPAAGAPQGVIDKWSNLTTKWSSWYPGVSGSWYVSDSDLANAKAIRSALMQNQNPDAWEWVQKTAADQPNRPAHRDRPGPIGKQSRPWERTKPMKTKAQVKELQIRLNAMGWKPPLKADGIYGAKTKAAEAAMLGKPAAVQTQEAASAASKSIAAAQQPRPKGPPKAKPKDEPVAIPPPGYAASTGAAITGVLDRVGGLKTVAGAALGGVGGFFLGGPAGAAAGFLSGGFLGSQFGGDEGEEC